jgi:accessory Sec system S-layer assembly protein
MLSFLKRAKKKGKDTTVSSNELLSGEEHVTQTNVVKQTLYLHHSWHEINQEQKYIYQFLHKELPSLQENQLSLSGIEVNTEGDIRYATTFVRSSISKPITLEEVTLLLLNEEKQVCARKKFDLSVLGEIPAHVNMPWVFTFEQHTWTEAVVPETGWQLAFELTGEHQLELAPEWEEQLPEEQKKKLRDIVAGLKPPNEGEINFFGLQAVHQDSGDLHITILIRNGTRNNISISQLPLHISDASGDIIAQGSFTLTDFDFDVKANTSKPWTFIFPASLVIKAELDLSTWKAAVPKQE